MKAAKAIAGLLQRRLARKWPHALASLLLCAALPAQALQGSHDASSCALNQGWAWDQSKPSTPISVDIYDGTTLGGAKCA